MSVTLLILSALSVVCVSHPLMWIIALILMSIGWTLFVSWGVVASWPSVILLITYVGGLVILLLYMVCSNSNFRMPILQTTVVVLPLTYLHSSMSIEYSHNTISMYIHPALTLVLFIILYILLVLYVIMLVYHIPLGGVGSFRSVE